MKQSIVFVKFVNSYLIDANVYLFHVMFTTESSWVTSLHSKVGQVRSCQCLWRLVFQYYFCTIQSSPATTVLFCKGGGAQPVGESSYMRFAKTHERSRKRMGVWGLTPRNTFLWSVVTTELYYSMKSSSFWHTERLFSISKNMNSISVCQKMLLLFVLVYGHKL